MGYPMIKIDHEYHAVEINDPYLYNQQTKEAIDWCCKTFGEPGKRWFKIKSFIYFLDKKDHMMFLLKWS